MSIAKDAIKIDTKINVDNHDVFVKSDKDMKIVSLHNYLHTNAYTFLRVMYDTVSLFAGVFAMIVR